MKNVLKWVKKLSPFAIGLAVVVFLLSWLGLAKFICLAIIFAGGLGLFVTRQTCGDRHTRRIISAVLSVVMLISSIGLFGSNTRKASRGRNTVAFAETAVEDAVNDAVEEAAEVCAYCNNTRKCQECGGSGDYYNVWYEDGERHEDIGVGLCSACNGTGKCSHCSVTSVKKADTTSGKSSSGKASSGKSSSGGLDLMPNFCSVCDGTGLCAACDGFGECGACFGSGGTTCGSCLGGQCLICGGFGYVYKSYGLDVKQVTCTNCRGSGTCRKCDGSGFINCSRCHGSGNCGSCGGTAECKYCHGSGEI